MRPLKVGLFMALVQAVNLEITKPKKVSYLSNQFKNEIDSLRSKNYSKSSKYCIEIYLTNARVGGGPGHISASLIKTLENKPEVIAHTSFMPGPMAIINGVSLGAVPVPAQNYPKIRSDDLHKAEKIIRIPLTKAAFQAGVAKQQEIEENTNKGINMYAITGRYNPIASFITALYSLYRGVEISLNGCNKERGFYPPEDHTGALVLDNAFHPDEHIPSELYNCTAAVQAILEGIGMVFNDRYVIPAVLAAEILKQLDAEIIEESLIPIENLEMLDEEDEHELDIPPP